MLLELVGNHQNVGKLIVGIIWGGFHVINVICGSCHLFLIPVKRHSSTRLRLPSTATPQRDVIAERR